MGLVEIILGKQTAPHTLAAAVDFVQKIRKTPIVVNDSRGFYTSRCFGTYTREGMAMLSEGIHPAMIENVGRMAGMPMGPLEVMDSVGVDTALKITRETRKELGASGTDAAEELLTWLVEKSNRPGRKTGRGFYDYDAKGKRSRLWPDLVASRSGEWRTDADVEEMKARFLTIQALEAARCFEEHVITDPRDADVGAILGWASRRSPAGRCLLSIRWAPPLSSRDAKPSSRNSASASGPTGSCATWRNATKPSTPASLRRSRPRE